MPGEMRLAFMVMLIAMTLLFVTLWKMELTSKSASDKLRKLRKRLEVSDEPSEATPVPAGAP